MNTAKMSLAEAEKKLLEAVKKYQAASRKIDSLTPLSAPHRGPVPQEVLDLAYELDEAHESMAEAAIQWARVKEAS